MANYIDGFVLPVPRERLHDYRVLVKAVADIWIQHGALEYREYVGEDLTHAGLRSFVDLAASADDEVIVFGWVEFESREARDAANDKVAADPRVADLLATADSGFDAGRMAYGGFQSFVRSHSGTSG